ncbi:hypothetical protein BDW42DRAFT_178278 [Aspergillus taichungensis]|uniref:Uncharacterized protein n=1 Tax=Aspergillus taichungensis TaxID=482145 RepID=A0A2J5HI98_9EURO|nr:hypothetical protein BDW42DRAFT_178278 [Aspergillus taichungensis]
MLFYPSWSSTGLCIPLSRASGGCPCTLVKAGVDDGCLQATGCMSFSLGQVSIEDLLYPDLYMSSAMVRTVLARDAVRQHVS